MKLRAIFGSKGITFSLSETEPQQLTPSPNANQDSPKRFYVYGHFDNKDVPFYIGKGKGKRAWNSDRHPLWHRYVENHLAGNYKVVILADDLDSEGAEELESQWIAQESETLVNWVNLGRKTDYAALERFHRLRDTNRKRIADAKELEKSDPEQVVQIYFETIEAIAEYANIHAEEGLVGNLLAEEKQEIGIKGEVMALDRLTLCLCRLGRKAEAAKAAEEYFYSYQADLQLGVATRIMKRVGQDQRNDG